MIKTSTKLVLGGLRFAATSLSPMQAAADYTACSSKKETQSQFGLDPNRAGAMCQSVASVHKFRAQLDRTGGTDYFSGWHWDTYTWHYTAWHTCYAGCSAKVQIANR
jgi:hypothetical protein